MSCFRSQLISSADLKSSDTQNFLTSCGIQTNEEEEKDKKAVVEERKQISVRRLALLFSLLSCVVRPILLQ